MKNFNMPNKTIKQQTIDLSSRTPKLKLTNTFKVSFLVLALVVSYFLGTTQSNPFLQAEIYKLDEKANIFYTDLDSAKTTIEGLKAQMQQAKEEAQQDKQTALDNQKLELQKEIDLRQKTIDDIKTLLKSIQ